MHAGGHVAGGWAGAQLHLLSVPLAPSRSRFGSLRDDGTRVLCVWWKGGGWGEATHIAWSLTRAPALAVAAAAVHPPPATTQVPAAAMIYDINSPLFKSYLTVGGVKT